MLHSKASARHRPRILALVADQDTLGDAVAKAIGLARPLDAEIEVLFVSPTGRGASSGGLGMGLVQANLRTWGHESPGYAVLQAACAALAEHGWIDGATALGPAGGDSAGETRLSCRDATGRAVTLWHRVADDIVAGVREHCRNRTYAGLVCDGALYPQTEKRRLFTRRSVAERLANTASLPTVIDRMPDVSAETLRLAGLKERADGRRERRRLFDGTFWDGMMRAGR